MKNILITGGTVFVSRYAAVYYAQKGYRVFVLNRNTRPQPEGVTLIEGDRHDPGDKLKAYHFDAVLDITAYNAVDIDCLLDAVGSYDDYILISSGAVYSEQSPLPFSEQTPLILNKFWGTYGTDKAAAEQALLRRNPDAYILRPPYLYGPMNNVYRESFVFDCALQNRKFYLPGDGKMELQFFHIHDLCRFMDVILEKRPPRHIFNVGNPDMISIRDWVSLCYRTAGKDAEFAHVSDGIEQRSYFCFYDYEYRLDVTEQTKLLPETKPLEEGLKEAFDWYIKHPDLVNRKNYIEYIDSVFKDRS